MRSPLALANEPIVSDTHWLNHVRVDASVNVDLTIMGHEIGEWPDHEVTLLVNGDDGTLEGVEMESDGCLIAITHETPSETARCVWTAAVRWMDRNMSTVDEARSRAGYAEPSERPEYTGHEYHPVSGL